MKTFFKGILFLVIAAVAVLAFANLRARWEVEERRAAIDRAIEERITVSARENARRNEIAARLQADALRSEQEAQARWDDAKNRGALPGNNTQPGFTPATGNAYRANPTRY